jgi:hypothetical protein
MVLSALPRLGASVAASGLPRQICCAARTMATGPFNDKERAEEVGYPAVLEASKE